MAVANNNQRAPVPDVIERGRQVYERVTAANVPMRRGPLLAEEGLGDDYFVRGDMVAGVLDGERTSPDGHNPPYYRQPPDRTLQRRQNLPQAVEHGNASWTRQDSYLGAFAAGTSQEGEQHYLTEGRSGRPYRRPNEAAIREDR